MLRRCLRVSERIFWTATFLIASAASPSGAAFNRQLGFTFVVPSNAGSGPFKLAQNDPLAAPAGYVQVGGPATLAGSTVAFPSAGPPNSLTTGEYHTNVLYREERRV